MKRKVEADLENSPNKKHSSTTGNLEVHSAFSSIIFQKPYVDAVQRLYQTSSPYPHAVAPSLINLSLLRSVREEITTHVSFTLKETDIYRIHQSGDLANLSNLDVESLKLLPSLVRLRDALYSYDFREWVSTITGAGKVSGQKTDMAVNVYTPGSYLLCHDDVIGSRRVSYILYLTDPDNPWQADWGGGLRLYPTEKKRNKDGEPIKVPSPEHTLNIPPSAGQLSFFAVSPGESYHDVEEVYRGQTPQEDRRRIRMAISGWYHIPEPGEDGYEDGLEESQAQKSSLAQLKGAASEFDEPQPVFKHFDEPRRVMDSHAQKTEIDPGDDLDTDEDILTEQDLTFLLRYISPSFLTPDMIEDFARSFEETSVLQLERFLNEKFATDLKQYIVKAESQSTGPTDKDHPSCWKTARPPHKHRFTYIQSSESRHKDHSPVSRLLADLLHSHVFKKWLALITGLKATSLIRQSAIARRFRHGNDYALASQFQGEQPQLEFTISMTPSSGWESDDDDQVKETAMNTNGHSNPTVKDDYVKTSSEIEYGGEEVYMVGEEDNDNDSVNSKCLPRVGKKVDPAVYKSTDADDEDDGILFTNAPSWNLFSIVLRDKGTLRFVKYVSKSAKGDRWDIKGEVELADDAFEGEDSQDEEDAEEQGHDNDDDDDDDDAAESDFEA